MPVASDFARWRRPRVRVVGGLLALTAIGVGVWFWLQVGKATADAEAALARGESATALALLDDGGLWPDRFLERRTPLRVEAWIEEGKRLLALGQLRGARNAVVALETLPAVDAVSTRRRQELLAAVVRAEAADSERRGEPLAAAAKLRSLGDQAGASAVLERTGHTAEAVNLWLELKEPMRAAEVWIQAGRRAAAAEILERAPNSLPDAARQWTLAAVDATEARDFAGAAVCFEGAARCFTGVPQLDEARAAWLNVAKSAAAAGDWPTAARGYREAHEWLAAVDALVRARRLDEADALIDREIVDSRERAHANLLAERFALAGQQFETLGRVEDALAAFRAGHDTAGVVRLLRRSGRLQEAAEAAEAAGLYDLSAEIWRAAKQSERATEALRQRALRDLRARDFGEITARVIAQPPGPGRRALLARLAGDFATAGCQFEFGSLQATAGEWSDAAATFEQAGAWPAACLMWRRAGRPAEAIRVVARAARESADPGLMLELAGQVRGSDEPGGTELVTQALERAVALEDFPTAARAYERRTALAEGAGRLLELAEQRGDEHPYEAAAAINATAELLRQLPVNFSSQGLVMRTNRATLRIRGAMDRLPMIGMERSEFSNRYDVANRFEHSEGVIELTNSTGALVPRLRLVIVCFDRAPELMERPALANVPQTSWLAVGTLVETGPLAWTWRRRDLSEAFGKAPAVFSHEQVVADLAPGERRLVRVTLANSAPYRRWRAAVTTDLPAAGR